MTTEMLQLSLPADAWWTVEEMIYSMDGEPAAVELSTLRDILDTLPGPRTYGKGCPIDADLPLWVVRHLLEVLIYARTRRPLRVASEREAIAFIRRVLGDGEGRL